MIISFKSINSTPYKIALRIFAILVYRHVLGNVYDCIKNATEEELGGWVGTECRQRLPLSSL